MKQPQTRMMTTSTSSSTHNIITVINISGVLHEYAPVELSGLDIPAYQCSAQMQDKAQCESDSQQATTSYMPQGCWFVMLPTQPSYALLGMPKLTT